MTTVSKYSLYAIPPRLLFLQLETDDGVTGWGEATAGNFGSAVEEAIDVLVGSHVLEEDPLRTENLWQKMYYGGFYHGGPILMSAISAIDQALWDLKGKLLDAPVFDLLNGRTRDRVLSYQLLGGDHSPNLVETAEEMAASGLKVLKMNLPSEVRHLNTANEITTLRENVERVHRAIGPDVSLAVDLHGRVAKPMIEQVLRVIETYCPMFVEEPLHPEHADDLPAVADGSSVPIAAGGRMYSQADFRRAIDGGAVDVVQPCVSHVGGITGMSKIAHMVEAAGLSLAPHNPVGPVSFASSLQIGVSAPPTLVQQQPFPVLDSHEGLFGKVIERGAFEYDDGYVTIDGTPGLGVALDEVVLEAESGRGIDFRFPIWRKEDGSVAKW